MKTLKEFSDLHYEPFLKNGKVWYRLLESIIYTSHRFNETCTVPERDESDGASGPAVDIFSKSWWVHDRLKKVKKWDSGNKCSNWQASWVIYDILMKENRWFRARTWFVATLCWPYIKRALGYGDEEKVLLKNGFDHNKIGPEIG